MREISDLKDIDDYRSLSNAGNIGSVNIFKSSMRFFTRKNLVFFLMIIISITFIYFFKGEIANKFRNCALIISHYISDKLINCGFAVDDIVINGNKFVPSDYIRGFVSVNKSILFLPLSELQKEIKDSSKWIKSVSVKRLLPNVLQIRVLEYLPFANWYHDDGSSIIDDTGHVIVSDYDEQDDLVSIYGNEALQGLHFIKKLVNENSVLSNMISSMFYFDDGSWDIVLSSGLNIKLPKENPYNAWNNLLSICEASSEFLIWKTVDMRVPTQINIEE
ncbi:cell division protein FtsQ/DivIB [Ehrlichia canis]|uniref:Cell division protein FtsQ n=1 Tax=Ehrlichia canis (strain Jake) TaxID=269484 RepID=A0ACA6AW97_EHRCJ|nr:cell division protein FtsQ/DivIB [Ehrlichia canis]AAZ68701.1 cell division protein FtsQ [Ehrlichia canis str. Jake]AUO54567.1 cell division protein FtsQ [Ehrlichia canis]UKC53403.1 FtsQ-type POTRA domain-containing protein [Ehrlichia canis]UKC54339.1 FtsQ-type POTRA domain-containing protein [Ehrlichia canis]UKC55275.1 FtsQ-type POTRA domain-containing protein [Ehrlichia canis]